MSSAVNMDPSNSCLYLQLLDLHTSGHAPPDMVATEALFAKVAGSTHLSEDVKDSFLARRQQLLEEFGGNFSESVLATSYCCMCLPRKKVFLFKTFIIMFSFRFLSPLFFFLVLTQSAGGD